MISKTLLALTSTALCLQPTFGEEPNPKEKPDGAWISISGTVANPTADSFMLDYGSGTILVEMDDWDWYGDAYGLLDGDSVTVYGAIDNDLYEKHSIEASSVYVEDLNSYFYASAADEEDVTFWTVTTPLVINQTTVRGTVAEVEPDEHSMTIDLGFDHITVETHEMLYNPLDDVGFQQIDVGDYVSVTGDMEEDFLQGNVLEADSIITLAEENDTADQMSANK